MIKTWARLMLSTTLVVTTVAAGVAQQPSATPKDTPYQPGKLDAITDVPGVTVGHFTYTKGTMRGTTVVLFGENGGLCAVDVRGSNPLTIGTHTFSPLTINEECDAVVLTGGSAFGLSSVSGVVNYLYDIGRGVQTRVGRIPIVPGAVIFDLPVGDPKIHPTPEWGYEAARSAKDGPVPQGNVGAGAGGTTGKTPAGIRLKGGLGTASVVLPDGVVVGAIVVLNALGDVVNPKTGEFYATSGGFASVDYRRDYLPGATAATASSSIENTTIAIVATNAKLNKTQLTKVAELAHNGLARAIRPIHTMLDGDTIFAVSVGWDKRVELKVNYPGEEVDRIGGVAADVMVRAIIKGMEAAESISSWTSYRDWKKAREAGKK
jgi:L-aminopeptidase/D-esterase-like protein